MMRAIAARPVIAGLLAYVAASAALGVVDGIRYRRDVKRRLHVFRSELETSPYANSIRARAIAKEPENAR